MEDENKKDALSPTADSRRVFRVIDGKTGAEKLVATKDGKVLTQPEPRASVMRMPCLHPDEYW